MPNASAPLDALIIGAGHNGLVCAAYLAKAGKRVLVLEARDVVGGAAVTEEFHPGFRNSVAAYTVSLLQPKVIADLALEQHGLQVVARRINNFLPLPNGEYLLAGVGRTAAEVAKFSARDAAALPAYEARLEQLADVLRALALEPPPDVTEGGWLRALPQLWRAGKVGLQLKELPLALRQDLLDLFTISAAEYLDRWFESAPIKALFGFDGIVGNYASPYAPGTAYVLLHHVFGQSNGVKGAWGHAIGGMGAITQAMAASGRAAGAQIRTGCAVAQVLVEEGHAVGVVTTGGETLRARAVVANVNPKLLYERLMQPQDVPTPTRERMAYYRCGSGTFRMNVALAHLPDFSALPGVGDHLTAGIILAPSLDYMDRAWQDARAFGWSRAPVVELLIPSTLDASLAPAGQHVASLFCQHVAPVLPDGRHWDDHREEVADLMIATVEQYAPGFAASVLGRQVLSPLDLERIFGLVGGDIFHGALSLNQLFSARPMLGQGGYRGAVPGLYLCGSGTHPGGGVTGAPGHNAARVVLQG
ncbi:phytoene desaturase family protein [Xanthomonas campestris]|uniref:phytoene desaturase family protein n=1 Tax=Xanthomonas campestris TaxID=339 RepID=UPI0023659E04|nr:NAD(P)/FAD-dependent oxidoreductase [Xanthomonas campestris]MEA9710719.1 NAD(P)/FAD-dependent oxidoreductase [Xanthomonas campestris]MEA9781935.1 NAD(P)/FAD-dependent oxidoreductase [Xanthomonas campestris pv. raphani]MEA9790285.1 NAD(P)/FAD-dependent oxidoreductase [Xanthomonas campestris pv. raphani]MEA9802035.1 NAD(P)/FAD-dependent oxidoreductase [Xanthomonas campestris pv. raphani]MEA9818422.1 NAD(P)/FAD-dependent oxidoreductase [Xanthomonas campestris pv. raphani]